MKFRCLIVSTVLLIALAWNAVAATITSTASGNWSDTTKWDLARIPAGGDTVALAGYTLALDVATIPATGTLLSITSTGTPGQMTLALQTAGTCRILNCTTMTAGTISSNGILAVSGTTSNTVTFTGHVIGGTVSGAYGIYFSSTGTVAIVGSCTGGSGSTSRAVLNGASGNITITSGTITGGSGSSAQGALNNSTGTITVTNCNVVGGTNASASGLTNSVAGGTITLNSSNLINSAQCVAFTGKPPIWNNASNINYIQWTNTGRSNKWATEPAASDLDSGVAAGSTTGTLVQAPVAKVVSGYQYGGDGTENTGIRVDAPVAKVLTTSGNYGDPGAPLVGTWVAAGNSDVRFGTANGVSPSAGSAYIPAATDVWFGVQVDQTTGTKRASSIANATASNIVDGIIIDDVTGTAVSETHTSNQVITTAGGDVVVPANSDVWYNVPVGVSPNVGSKRASSIANVIASNVKLNVVVDDVTGTYMSPYMPAADIRYGVDRGDGTLGLIRVPSANEVIAGTLIDTTVGNFVVPTVGTVTLNTLYGASGTQYTGAYVYTNTTPIPIITTSLRRTANPVVTLNGTCDPSTTKIFVNDTTKDVTYTSGSTTWRAKVMLRSGTTNVRVMALDGNNQVTMSTN